MTSPGVNGSARDERLRRQVERLGTGGGAARVQRRLMIMGAALLPLGLVVIVIGWFGAANTPRIFEQIPYLISGGLLGLGLVFIGGFMYFAYWLTRLVALMREHTGKVELLLERIDRLQLETVAGAPTEELVATPRGSQYHRKACPVVAGRDDVRPVSRSDVAGTPCKICQPSISL